LITFFWQRRLLADADIPRIVNGFGVLHSRLSRRLLPPHARWRAFWAIPRLMYLDNQISSSTTRQPAAAKTDFDGDHREHGAMAAASANECPAANALVSAGRSFGAESPDLRRERYARPGLCRRGALGSPPVLESGLSPHVLDSLIDKPSPKREQKEQMRGDEHDGTLTPRTKTGQPRQRLNMNPTNLHVPQSIAAPTCRLSIQMSRMSCAVLRVLACQIA
jgi:hypothetical protein